MKNLIGMKFNKKVFDEEIKGTIEKFNFLNGIFTIYVRKDNGKLLRVKYKNSIAAQKELDEIDKLYKQAEKAELYSTPDMNFGSKLIADKEKKLALELDEIIRTKEAKIVLNTVSSQEYDKYISCWIDEV